MMRIISAALVAGLMLVGAPSVFADTFKSAVHKFSANFPGAVEQGAPEDNATDPDGNNFDISVAGFGSDEGAETKKNEPVVA